jgi:hypothetical protein
MSDQILESQRCLATKGGGNNCELRNGHAGPHKWPNGNVAPLRAVAVDATAEKTEAPAPAPKAPEPERAEVELPPQPDHATEEDGEEEDAIDRRDAPPLEPGVQHAEAIVPAKAPLSTFSIGVGGIRIENLDQLWRFANVVVRSGIAPEGDTPETVMIKIELGLEVGLAPMQSLSNIAVINRRAGLFGDAGLALVRASGQLEDFDEWFEVDGKTVVTLPAWTKLEQWNDTTTAHCLSKRKNMPREIVRSFSVAQAKAAKLWAKTGRGGTDTPWITHPWRMLQFRARWFNLRDGFGDRLKGFRSAEELQDMAIIDTTAVSSSDSEARPRRISETAATS